MISDIKSALKSSIETALGIPCHKGVPSVMTPPCAWIKTGEGNYTINLGATKSQRNFDVTLVFARAEALEGAQDRLDTYFLPTGTTSMKLAIQGSTVSSSTADFYRVVSDTGAIEITHEGNSYIGARWTIQTMI